MIFKNQGCALRFRQTIFNQRQIQILVAAVKFIADDGVANVREVDADLMLAAGARNDSQQREIFFFARKSPPDKKFRLRRRAAGTHAIFDDDAAGFILAERRVNQAVVFAQMAVDDGQIFFFNRAAFENFSQLTCDNGIFRDDDHAARFAVETIDQMWFR